MLECGRQHPYGRFYRFHIGHRIERIKTMDKMGTLTTLVVNNATGLLIPGVFVDVGEANKSHAKRF